MTVVPIHYEAVGRKIEQFHRSNDFVRVLIGPFGSGKTTACCMEIFLRACRQQPNAHGVRRTRWLCVRRTYPELQKSTIKSWRELFGEAYGKYNWNEPITQHMNFALADGTRVEAEVVFMALDGPRAEENIHGSEWTGAWINETKEVSKPILDVLMGRVGRFPRRVDVDPTWFGIFCDTNAPDDDHWLYRLAEIEKPAGWKFFIQPGGLKRDPETKKWVANPDAENLQNLPPNYYVNQMAGQTEDKIRVNLANEYGFVREGRPVFPEYIDIVHTADLTYEPGDIYVGADFGLTPAAVIAKRDARGRILILEEVVCEDIGAVTFGRQLRHVLATRYNNSRIHDLWGDPAGAHRAQTDEKTVFQILNELGLRFRPAPAQDFTTRREAVASALTRMIDGGPMLLVDRSCKTLRSALNGRYCFKRLMVDQERYQDRPVKNEFSHIADALQYLCVGLGLGRNLITSQDRLANRPKVFSTAQPRKPNVLRGSRLLQRRSQHGLW